MNIRVYSRPFVVPKLGTYDLDNKRDNKSTLRIPFYHLHHLHHCLSRFQGHKGKAQGLNAHDHHAHELLRHHVQHAHHQAGQPMLFRWFHHFGLRTKS